MPLGICYYCRKAPATHGYPDIKASQHCQQCGLTRVLSSSVQDIRSSAAADTDRDAIQRALTWETKHRKRSTVVSLLTRRLKQLGEQSDGGR